MAIEQAMTIYRGEQGLEELHDQLALTTELPLPAAYSIAHQLLPQFEKLPPVGKAVISAVVERTPEVVISLLAAAYAHPDQFGQTKPPPALITEEGGRLVIEDDPLLVIRTHFPWLTSVFAPRMLDNIETLLERYPVLRTEVEQTQQMVEAAAKSIRKKPKIELLEYALIVMLRVSERLPQGIDPLIITSAHDFYTELYGLIYPNGDEEPYGLSVQERDNFQALGQRLLSAVRKQESVLMVVPHGWGITSEVDYFAKIAQMDVLYQIISALHSHSDNQKLIFQLRRELEELLAITQEFYPMYTEELRQRYGGEQEGREIPDRGHRKRWTLGPNDTLDPIYLDPSELLFLSRDNG